MEANANAVSGLSLQTAEDQNSPPPILPPGDSKLVPVLFKGIGDLLENTEVMKRELTSRMRNRLAGTRMDEGELLSFFNKANKGLQCLIMHYYYPTGSWAVPPEALHEAVPVSTP